MSILERQPGMGPVRLTDIGLSSFSLKLVAMEGIQLIPYWLPTKSTWLNCIEPYCLVENTGVVCVHCVAPARRAIWYNCE